MKTDNSWSPGDVDLAWIDSLARPPHPVLMALEQAAEPGHVPILDRDSGRVLSALASDRRAIVEVGTAIGYSTLWMALGQPADGTIVTIDPDASRTAVAREHWRSAGIADARIRVVNEPALDAFASGAAQPDLAGPFDLVFIDALKEEYTAYLQALLPRLRPGALVVADNVLWSGKSSGARPSRPGDGTDALRAFCSWVIGDARFSGTVLPIGDGLLVAAFRP
ncbi:MAG: O-methyltransferase family 3 [Chloroflexi bacterium]|nr:O-methyltransferase family 3 [Chloroflexota bacterium]